MVKSGKSGITKSVKMKGRNTRKTSDKVAAVPNGNEENNDVLPAKQGRKRQSSGREVVKDNLGESSVQESLTQNKKTQLS